MPMYTNIGGGTKQLTSIYINKDGTRKSISNAYANINAISKEIFAQLYSWIKYTYHGSDTREAYPYLEIWSSEKVETDVLPSILADGLYIATSYTIDKSTKKVSLVNPKFLYAKSSATLHYDYQDYPYDYLSTITTVPQWTLIDLTNYRGLTEVDYSGDNLFQTAYGYRISEIIVNPIEIRCTSIIRNGDVRLMEYQSQTIVYSSNKNEYKSSSRTDLGSDFYLDWYNSDAGTQYYYKKLF